MTTTTADDRHPCPACGARRLPAAILNASPGEEIRALLTADVDLVIEIWRRDQQHVLPGGAAVLQRLAHLLGREVR